MKNRNKTNADRDSCIQSFIQACDAFARVRLNEEELNNTNNKAKIKERETRVKFDMSRNEVFLI